MIEITMTETRPLLSFRAKSRNLRYQGANGRRSLDYASLRCTMADFARDDNII